MCGSFLCAFSLYFFFFLSLSLLFSSSISFCLVSNFYYLCFLLFAFLVLFSLTQFSLWFPSSKWSMWICINWSFMYLIFKLSSNKYEEFILFSTSKNCPKWVNFFIVSLNFSQWICGLKKDGDPSSQTMFHGFSKGIISLVLLFP